MCCSLFPSPKDEECLESCFFLFYHFQYIKVLHGQFKLNMPYNINVNPQHDSFINSHTLLTDIE